MTRIVGEISVSLDGFVTGPNPGPDNGLGDGGDALHAWVFSDDPVDRELLRRSTETSGAVILGRRLFDIVDGPQGWSEDFGYGAEEAGRPPFFVVTSSPPASTRLPYWTFVTTGLPDAVAQARSSVDAAGGAGADRDVVLMGGGATIASALDAGLLDELRLHVSPVVLGAGTPLFTPGRRHGLVQREATPSSTAVHVVYDVER
ncbi:dihydrofolate reductase family protein [Isoptericola variabilis]|uniref:Bifunctional deaminase-reductase domain protein n=1 Tax=Isoptericola variabilis (strain 225) TaxID=743718 RepID=F6FV28_ISOV2|nr:dihydrofolate reductase family protein [Isoptericola variabilis]AEG45456.1 bifunctional deaminase-reductase domain protein [Isoptericola variabilis 225]TWH31521.1 dihydrofolate reductase [Isoptericola variabilis J7]